MNINNMGINNMPNAPMNFNNQLGINLMNMGNLNNDNNSLYIKNIIKPYEDKIKELEEKLRQKEFEIACLKNQLICNNQMNMMANQINQISPMMNPPIQKDEISVEFENKEYSETKKIKCRLDELVFSMINKYSRRYLINESDYIFLYYGKKLNEKLTVSECGIEDNSKIIVINKKNLKKSDSAKIKEDKKRFVYNLIFDNKIIKCYNDKTIENSIKKFFERTNFNYNDFLINNIWFLYNASKIIRSDLEKTLEQFFGLDRLNPRIVVHYTNNLIGN